MPTTHYFLFAEIVNTFFVYLKLLRENFVQNSSVADGSKILKKLVAEPDPTLKWIHAKTLWIQIKTNCPDPWSGTRKLCTLEKIAHIPLLYDKQSGIVSSDAQSLPRLDEFRCLQFFIWMYFLFDRYRLIRLEPFFWSGSREILQIWIRKTRRERWIGTPMSVIRQSFLCYTHWIILQYPNKFFQLTFHPNGD